MTARKVFVVLLISVSAILYSQGPPPPPPLGPPPVPPGNPVTTAKANLGKALFWDEQLSATGTVACGTCHKAPNGGSDPRSTRTSAAAVNPGADGTFGNGDDVVGSPGVPSNQADGSYAWHSIFGYREQVTARKARSYIDAAYSPELFWDGRASSTFRDPVTNAVVIPAGGALESQAAAPPIEPGEMSHIGRAWTEVAADVAAAKPLALSPSVPTALSTWIGTRSYPELFQEAFGSPDVTPSRIILAIATYERTVYSDQTPFDAFLGGNPGALTAQEQRGLGVFNGARCSQCHTGGLTSDNQYHFIGVRPSAEDLGRFTVTGNNPDRGAFRTPVLRNVALRGPFMQGGQFTTLEEVVEFYNRGGDFREPNLDPRIAPLNLSPGQKADLLAFLRRPLTDPRVAAETAPFDRPTLYTESNRVPVVAAGGVPGSGGVVPSVMAIEPPLLGNANFTVGVTGGLANAKAVLVIDDNPPPANAGVPATGSLARRLTTLSAEGAGSISMALPTASSFAGRTYHGRWYVQDPGAAGGVAVSNAFQMTLFGDGIVASEGATGFQVF